MIAVSIIKIAFEALLANKLRSSLTLLGIIIGVTSVMTIISALEGMMQSIEDDLARLGSWKRLKGNQLIMNPWIYWKTGVNFVKK